MKKTLIYSLFVVFLLTACSAVERDIEIHNAWVRPTAQGQNAAVYFSLHNHTDTDEELLSISSNVTDTIEIHETKVENDVAQMTMLDSLPIAADEEITFGPGGLHVMLVGVQQELVLGEHIGIILHFREHADIVVNVHVENTVPEDDHPAEEH